MSDCVVCGKRKGTILINKVYKDYSCRKCQVDIMNYNIAENKRQIESLKTDIAEREARGHFDNENYLASIDWHQQRLDEYAEKGIRATWGN